MTETDRPTRLFIAHLIVRGGCSRAALDIAPILPPFTGHQAIFPSRAITIATPNATWPFITRPQERGAYPVQQVVRSLPTSGFRPTSLYLRITMVTEKRI